MKYPPSAGTVVSGFGALYNRRVTPDMPRRSLFVALRFAAGTLALILAVTAIPVAQPAGALAGAPLDTQFNHVVKPFVAQYCVACHSGNTPAAQFDLSSYTSMDLVVRDHPRWALVIDKLTSKQMPPTGMPAPSDEARQKVIEWVKAMRADEARKHAGDPGPVLARRLSNSESRSDRRRFAANARVSGGSGESGGLR